MCHAPRAPGSQLMQGRWGTSSGPPRPSRQVGQAAAGVETESQMLHTPLHGCGMWCMCIFCRQSSSRVSHTVTWCAVTGLQVPPSLRPTCHALMWARARALSTLMHSRWVRVLGLSQEQESVLPGCTCRALAWVRVRYRTWLWDALSQKEWGLSLWND